MSNTVINYLALRLSTNVFFFLCVEERTPLKIAQRKSY
jgi:hypothetical protein